MEANNKKIIIFIVILFSIVLYGCSNDNIESNPNPKNPNSINSSKESNSMQDDKTTQKNIAKSYSILQLRKKFDLDKLKKISNFNNKEELEEKDIEYLKECEDDYCSLSYAILYKHDPNYKKKLINEVLIEIDEDKYMENKDFVNGLTLLYTAQKVEEEIKEKNPLLVNFILYKEFENSNKWYSPSKRLNLNSDNLKEKEDMEKNDTNKNRSNEDKKNKDNLDQAIEKTQKKESIIFLGRYFRNSFIRDVIDPHRNNSDTENLIDAIEKKEQ